MPLISKLLLHCILMYACFGEQLLQNGLSFLYNIRCATLNFKAQSKEIWVRHCFYFFCFRVFESVDGLSKAYDPNYIHIGSSIAAPTGFVIQLVVLLRLLQHHTLDDTLTSGREW